MSRFLISPEIILTLSGKPLEKNSVYVKDGKICSIAATSILKRNNPGIKQIRLKDSILLPGFINAHVHLELGWIAKYTGGFNTFAEWLVQIINAKNRKTGVNTIKKSVTTGIDALIKSGTTTVGEISSYDGIDKSILRKSGLRSVIFNEVFDRHLDELENQSYSSDDMYEERLFPHATYSCSPNTLACVNKICRKNNIKSAIHLAESREEISFVNKRANLFEKDIYPLINKLTFSRKPAQTPVGYLTNYKFFEGMKSTLIHMVQVIEEDVKKLANKDVGIVLCPRSNKFLNVGLPPVNLYKDISRLGIGTDGLSSNFNLDMFEELRFFYMTYREELGEDAAYKTLYLATLGGARSLFMESIIGSIETGKYADLIAIKPKMKYIDPYLSVISSGTSDLVMSMVNGKLLYSRNFCCAYQ